MSRSLFCQHTRGLLFHVQLSPFYLYAPFWCVAEKVRVSNADAVLFPPVMTPQALCLSGLLCATSLSFITGHDGLHQLILAEQETFTSPLRYLSLCFSAHLSICHVTFMHLCRISAWFGSRLTRGWCQSSSSRRSSQTKKSLSMSQDSHFPSPQLGTT